MKVRLSIFAAAAWVLAASECAPAQTVYVDGNYDESWLGQSDGSSAHPYPTVSRAAEAVAAGATLVIQGNTYTEPCHFPLTITKPLTLTRSGGPATMGIPPGN